MWTDQRRLRLLESIGMAEAVGEVLDVSELAAELGVSEPDVQFDLEDLRAHGLALDGLEEVVPPRLLHAGRQLLARRGAVDPDVVRFLPLVIDDLNTREALLTAGAVLVDVFRAALLSGGGVGHARGLVPRAFSRAVDEHVALDLYAAAVALVARLSEGAPAGCVAEEVIAVALIEEARSVLEAKREAGELGPEDERAAGDELHGLFELFEDDDVLALFEMSEPADAAVAGNDPINRQLGVADQRLEAWFDPFSWAAPTGYLHDRG